MAEYNVVFSIPPVYQGMPLQMQWGVFGPDQQASAIMDLSLNGSVLWTSPPVQLPTASANGIQSVTIPPPADPALANLLYATPGQRPLQLTASVTVAGIVTAYSSQSSVLVLVPQPQLAVNSPILPGAPITIVWGLDAALAYPQPADLPVSVYVALKTPAVFKAVALIPVNTLPVGGPSYTGQSFTFVVAPPDDVTAYSLGWHPLRLLIILRSGGFTAYYETDGGYEAGPESVGPSWWQWTSPPGGAVFTPPLPPPGNTPFLKVSEGWNTSYVLGGRLVSEAVSSVLNAQIELQVTGAWEEPPPPSSPLTTLASAKVGPLSPGENDATGDAIFPAQIQNYAWLDQATGIFSQGAVRQELTYYVSITLKDAFGNVYPAFSSPGFSIDGSVPDGKLTDADLAKALLINAGVAALIAVLLGAWGFIISGGATAALSALLYVLFQQQIANAKDPPKKSPLYRKPVNIRLPRIPKELAGSNCAGLREFVTLVAYTSAARKALSRIAGRYLGAAAARDSRRMQLQLSSYKAVLQQLSATDLLLSDAAIRASHDMNRMLTPRIRTEYRKAVAGLVKKGVTPELRKQMRQCGLGAEFINHIAKAARNREWTASIPLSIHAKAAQGQFGLFISMAEATRALNRAILLEAGDGISGRARRGQAQRRRSTSLAR